MTKNKSKKNIDDKVLLKSIADLIMMDSSAAKDIYNSRDIILDVFPELDVVMEAIGRDDVDFSLALKDKVNDIKDKEIKDIFNSAIAQHLNR